jgi:hypothetical protein
LTAEEESTQQDNQHTGFNLNESSELNDVSFGSRQGKKGLQHPQLPQTAPSIISDQATKQPEQSLGGENNLFEYGGGKAPPYFQYHTDWPSPAADAASEADRELPGSMRRSTTAVFPHQGMQTPYQSQPGGGFYHTYEDDWPSPSAEVAAQAATEAERARELVYLGRVAAAKAAEANRGSRGGSGIANGGGTGGAGSGLLYPDYAVDWPMNYEAAPSPAAALAAAIAAAEAAAAPGRKQP